MGVWVVVGGMWCMCGERWVVRVMSDLGGVDGV